MRAVLWRGRSRAARERVPPAGGERLAGAEPAATGATAIEPALTGPAAIGQVTLSGAPADAAAGPGYPALLHAPTGRLPAHVRGRDDLLARLRALAAEPDGRAHVLAGPGGTGKSTVALLLAQEAAGQDRQAWWVPAADAQTVTVTLLELAAGIGARPGEVAQAKAGQRDPADLLWRYLDEQTGWLLVFDNAEDPDVLSGWLRPAAAGLIVVTSRNGDPQAWGEHAQAHAVGGLDEEAAGQVLMDRASRSGSDKDAAALAERLRGLPLALQHAGSRLAAGQAIAGYTKALNECFERLTDARPDERQIVASTCRLSLDALAASGQPEAGTLLRVLSCLAPGVEIPAAMLDPRVTEAAELDALCAAGLAAADGTTAGVTVHPMVSAACRLHPDAGDPARAGGVAVAMLSAAAGTLSPQEPKDWPAWVRLVPHVNAVYENAAGREAAGDLAALPDLAALAGVAAAAAAAFLRAGCYPAAADIAGSGLRHAQRLGGDHEAVLRLRDVVARALAQRGFSGAAELEFRDVLAARERALGPEHPRTLATRYEIATALAGQGRHEQAERELRDVLAAQVRVLGADDQGTLATRYEIARTLAEQGKYLRAEAAFRDLLAAKERAVGPRHPDTLAIRYQLARLLAQQGHYEQAEQRLRDLLADSGPLGDDHPSTLTTRQDFALVLAERGQYEQAARELRDLLTARVRVLGPEHRQTRLTQRWLSYVAARDGGVRSD